MFAFSLFLTDDIESKIRAATDEILAHTEE